MTAHPSQLRTTRRPAPAQRRDTPADRRDTTQRYALGGEDFQQFIHCGRGTAAIDSGVAVSALGAGGLPSSGGERRMFRVAASLGEAITGIDDRNVGLLMAAVCRASGRRQFSFVP